MTQDSPAAHAPRSAREVRARAAASETAAAASVSAASCVHAVVHGDTLWALAARRLGDPRRWPELFRANRDMLSNPDRLLPGKPVRIPGACDSRP